jgi:transaldolase
MDQAMFKELHESEQMAVDKLKDGIDGFAADQEELESLLATVAKEQKLRFAAA